MPESDAHPSSVATVSKSKFQLKRSDEPEQPPDYDHVADRGGRTESTARSQYSDSLQRVVEDPVPFYGGVRPGTSKALALLTLDRIIRARPDIACTAALIDGRDEKLFGPPPRSGRYDSLVGGFGEKRLDSFAVVNYAFLIVQQFSSPDKLSAGLSGRFGVNLVRSGWGLGTPGQTSLTAGYNGQVKTYVDLMLRQMEAIGLDPPQPSTEEAREREPLENGTLYKDATS